MITLEIVGKDELANGAGNKGKNKS